MSSSLPVTELKNFNLATIGDFELGRCPAVLASPRVAHVRDTLREIAVSRIMVESKTVCSHVVWGDHLLEVTDHVNEVLDLVGIYRYSDLGLRLPPLLLFF